MPFDLIKCAAFFFWFGWWRLVGQTTYLIKSLSINSVQTCPNETKRFIFAIFIKWRKCWMSISLLAYNGNTILGVKALGYGSFFSSLFPPFLLFHKACYCVEYFFTYQFLKKRQKQWFPDVCLAVNLCIIS